MGSSATWDLPVGCREKIACPANIFVPSFVVGAVPVSCGVAGSQKLLGTIAKLRMVAMYPK
jgi:hypothetical protein